MTTRQIEIFLDHFGYGKVSVDGHELSQYVSDIALHSIPGKPPEVTLTIAWPHVICITQAKIETDVGQIQESTAALLYKALRKRFYGDESSPTDQLGDDAGDRGAFKQHI